MKLNENEQMASTTQCGDNVWIVGQQGFKEGKHSWTLKFDRGKNRDDRMSFVSL